MSSKKNDLLGTLLIVTAAGCMIIAIGAIMQGRFAKDYWVLMISLIAFFVYSYRRNQEKD
jgi:hypothetical protein